MQQRLAEDFGCAVVTQALTFDTDPVALSASPWAAVACFQAIRTANLHRRFVHCHDYLRIRCLVYESMHSSYRTSATTSGHVTMTERDYEKSEHDRHLSRTALL